VKLDPSAFVADPELIQALESIPPQSPVAKIAFCSTREKSLLGSISSTRARPPHHDIAYR